MAKKKTSGSVKRFGPRYGRRIKRRLAEIEDLYKKKQKCPYCLNLKVKRLSKGIWECLKCKTKFTARAYSVQKTKIEVSE